MRRPERLAVAVTALAALAGCATITEKDSAWIETEGKAQLLALGCPPREPLATKAGELPSHRELNVVSWNIHRNADVGWESDLARLASASDVVILQEATLTAALRDQFARAGRVWTHADAWAFDGINSGVLTAAAAAPDRACVQRAAEPLITLPKSALVAWYRIHGRTETLAVANVHAVNFTLDLTVYQRQIENVIDVLAPHKGPVILAGDFNTWSPVRVQVLENAAARIGLTEAKPLRGERSMFMGMLADYIFVRGLAVEDVWVEQVTSSDHQPIRAKLRLPPT
ncbi:MAG TPA: endonuclease/exonuclease/phosphatase family protein [Casimicrobiaceae bacterium]